jgi:NAD+ synthase (glutamine-hydrolysing)
MPSLFKSSQSKIDSEKIAKALHIDLKEVSIEPTFESFLKTLEFNAEGGLAEENLQARIRGTLLMAFSNKWGHLVLNTSNKSEMALGYTTLYGDMCGALAVIGDVLKGQVYQLAEWINRTQEILPLSVLKKAAL